MKKYMTSIGQNTGTLKHSKKVVKIATSVEITVCSLKCKEILRHRILKSMYEVN